MDEELLQELIGGEDKRQFNDLVKEEVTLQMAPMQESLNQLTHRVQVSSLQSQEQNNKQSIDN